MNALLSEIPDFLLSGTKIIYCDCLALDTKTFLVLTKNLKFYEFRKKQLVYSNDLQKTCLTNIAERLQNYDGSRGKWLNEKHNLDLANASKIIFGKYVYRNNKIFILVQCWDKLIVQLRPVEPSADYKVVAEYENVVEYKLIKDRIKYEVLVEIKFENGSVICTDFHDSVSNAETTNNKCTKAEFRQMLQRVSSAQTELQLHRAMTQKDFAGLCDMQTFGKNIVRSHRLEEKQLLSRCGDIWARFTFDNKLVLGVPLVNNCTSKNLTIIKSLRPIFRCNDMENASGLSYQYRMFQLKQNLEDFDSIELFLQCENDQLQTQCSAWYSRDDHCLMPESFAVLLIKLNATQIVAQKSAQLFLNFYIEKQIDLDNDAQSTTTRPMPKSFEQQLFLRVLNFEDIMRERQSLEISFSKETLQQDFLAATMAQQELSLTLQYASTEDYQMFMHLLITKFDFDSVEDSTKKHKQSPEDDYEMDRLESPTPEWQSTQNTLRNVFFNKKPTSLWHGILLLQRTLDDLKIVWTFYAKNNEQICFLLKTIFDDLIQHKCGISCVQILQHKDVINNETRSIKFKDALLQELHTLVENTQHRRPTNNNVEQFEQFWKIQMQTDCLATVIKKNS